MQASIVDLRYKMNDVKKAIENNQIVTVTDRGRVIADILPRKKAKACLAEEHPFFGSDKENKLSVEEVMTRLRGGRYNDI